MRRLLECKDDIIDHLQSCHLFKLIGNVEEHDLVLMKAGKLDLPMQHTRRCARGSTDHCSFFFNMMQDIEVGYRRYSRLRPKAKSWWAELYADAISKEDRWRS